jgi:hypothetical protein
MVRAVSVGVAIAVLAVVVIQVPRTSDVDRVVVALGCCSIARPVAQAAIKNAQIWPNSVVIVLRCMMSSPAKSKARWYSIGIIAEKKF